jgi:ribosome biogenesis GTPase A
VNRYYLIPKFVSSKLGFNLNLRYLNVRIVKYITPLVNYQFFKMLRNFAVILRGFEVKFSTNAHKISDIPPNEDFKTRLLKVAVIGIPNVGKSTFINNLMDRKVCPTSSKVHTTRAKCQAIFTERDSQIVFLDTPGLVSLKEQKKYFANKSIF